MMFYIVEKIGGILMIVFDVVLENILFRFE